MKQVGLGPFPISAYGLPDKDNPRDDEGVTFKGGYETGLGGTMIDGRQTRLQNAQNARPNPEPRGGFRYLGRQDGV